MFRLLIVDDEKVVADGLGQFINWEKVGFKVEGVAYSADEAIRIVKEKTIDILLTDIIMGEKNGIQLLEEVIEYNNEIKGVILSGHEEFEFAQSAIKLGVYDYLVKPVEFEELEKLFEKISMRLKKERGILDEKSQPLLDENGISKEKSEGVIINTVKEYISKHFEENLCLNMLAEMVYVHPTYLSILFKKKTGSNFKDYISYIRIKQAKELLDDLSLRIIDVSYRVGYDSPKYFSKIFKEITGVTPKDYRNRETKSV